MRPPPPAEPPPPFVPGNGFRFKQAYTDYDGVSYRAGSVFGYLGSRQVWSNLFLRSVSVSGCELEIETGVPEGLEKLVASVEAVAAPPPPVRLDRSAVSGIPPEVPERLRDHDQARDLIHELVTLGDFAAADRVVRQMLQLPDEYGHGVAGAAWHFEQEGHASPIADIALWYYGQSRNMYAGFASGSTSGGEGVARMRPVRRLEKLCSDYWKRWFPERQS